MSKHPNKKQREVGSMGMSSHRKSGVAPKSPRTRFKMMLEAKKNEVKSKPPLEYDDVKKLFSK